MGKSGKLLNTLAAVVNSFKSPSKEKPESEKCSRREESERKTRRGYKDNRCLWSLGKSSSHRSRDVIVTAPFPDVEQVKSAYAKEEKGEELVENQGKDLVFVASGSLSTVDPATAEPPPKTQNAEVAVSHGIPITTTSIEASEDLDKRNWAASMIQAAFRRYLARRALQALKALVKLQALVRGRTVRKRAAATLKCMHMLIRLQALVRGCHVRESELGQLVQKHVTHRKQQSQTSVEGRTGSISSLQMTAQNRQDSVIRQQRVLVHVLSEQIMKSASKSCNAKVNRHPIEDHWVWMWLELWTRAHSRGMNTNGMKDQYDHVIENTEGKSETQLDMKSCLQKIQDGCYSDLDEGEQVAFVRKSEEKIKEVVVREYESNRDIVEDTHSCSDVHPSMKLSLIEKIEGERTTTSVHEINASAVASEINDRNADNGKASSDLGRSNGNHESSVVDNVTVYQLAHPSLSPSPQCQKESRIYSSSQEDSQDVELSNTTSHEISLALQGASEMPNTESSIAALSSSVEADSSPVTCNNRLALTTPDMDHRSSLHIMQYAESSVATLENQSESSISAVIDSPTSVVQPSVMDSQNGHHMPTELLNTLAGCDTSSEQIASLKEQAVSPRIIAAAPSPSISEVTFEDSLHSANANGSSLRENEVVLTREDDEVTSESRIDLPKDNDGFRHKINASYGMNGKCNGQSVPEVSPKPEQHSLGLMYEQQVEVVSPSIPNYMATTKSSKAKARSINSPKQKLDPLKLRTDSSRENLDSLKLRADSPKLKTESPKLRTDTSRINKPDPTVKRRHSLSSLEGKASLSSGAQKPTMHVRANSKGQLNHVNTDVSPGLKVSS